MNEVYKEGFSIVVCTYNGQKFLYSTLKHLASLQIPANYAAELILVNNASTDNTVSFVQETWSKLGNPFLLQILHENRPGKGYAVETGYDAANYELIVTVDDDNWLSKDYLLHTYQFYLANPSFRILGGKSIPEFEEILPNWVEDVLYHNAIGIQQSYSGRMEPSNKVVWGAGMVVRKSFWKSLRSSGFSFITSKQAGKAIGEDTELSITAILAGNDRFYNDQLVFKHFMPKGRFNWVKMLKQFAGFGSTHIIFDAYYYIFHCVQNNKRPSAFYWIYEFAKKLKGFKKFTIKQWFFYFFIRPEGEYYILKQKLFLSELKHTFLFYKIQKEVFRSLYNWQYNFFRYER